jgi:predicted PurR-regulated permease PerM
MTRTTAGVVIGLVLGLALAFGSFGQMLIVALFAVIGFVVAKVLEGDLDLSPYLSRRREGR